MPFKDFDEIARLENPIEADRKPCLVFAHPKRVHRHFPEETGKPGQTGFLVPEPHLAVWRRRSQHLAPAVCNRPFARVVQHLDAWQPAAQNFVVQIGDFLKRYAVGFAAARNIRIFRFSRKAAVAVTVAFGLRRSRFAGFPPARFRVSGNKRVSVQTAFAVSGVWG